ncbi:MAG: hypothetical protein KTR16_02645 [Acidiferrobacterales bacterium]|nr:hypothetical protein [Acidiferrobacterales bacterium]
MNSYSKPLYATLVTTAIIGFFTQTASAQMGPPPAPEPLPLGFFITSVGVGNGADLGGIDGADAHCQELAEAVEAGDRTWRAFLSTQATESSPAENAIDRIGEGPWGNAKGLAIAADIEALIYDNSNLSYEHALNEKGETVNSRAFGDDPNMHDILTGTKIDGSAFPAGDDMTCSNWTSSDEGAAAVGHHDRHRGVNPGSSWLYSHPSRGCSQDALAGSGGAGLFYCFAAD